MFIPWWALIIIFFVVMGVDTKIEKLENRVRDLEEKLDDIEDNKVDSFDLDIPEFP